MKWLFKVNNLLLTLKWLYIKINNKFISRKKFKYPIEIATYINQLNIGSPKYINLYKGNTSVINFQISKIKLASRFIDIRNNDLDWYQQFEDSEDIESLHRWNWMINEISNKNNRVEYDELIFYQRGWYRNFNKELDKAHENKNKLRWSSYTVAERISNTILISNYYDKDIPSDILEYLREQFNFLLLNLEYFEKTTGNHIINNARAIYLYSSYIQDLEKQKLAKLIFVDQMHRLVSKDGFLREGSSHYHFLFLRWILEVYIFSKKNNDLEFSNYLKIYILKLYEVSHNFFFDNAEKEALISLFGDISPDFEPKWLASVIHSDLMPYKLEDDLSINIPTFSWNHIWSKEENENKISIIKNINFFFNQSKNYSKSGWFFLNNKSFRVLVRAPIKSIADNVGHYSHDLFHFNLIINNQPFLISLGRLNYIPEDNTSLIGLTSTSHNTILIDKLGYIPKRINIFPKEYSQTNNNISFSDESIRISSDGFKRINNSIETQRELKINSDNLVITDTIKGHGKHEITRLFYIDNKFTLTENNLINKSKRVLKFTNQGKIVFFKINDNNISNKEIIVLNDKKDIFSYGNFKNCTMICIKSNEVLPARLNIEISSK